MQILLSYGGGWGSIVKNQIVYYLGLVNEYLIIIRIKLLVGRSQTLFTY
jgi:hypothetical protein